MVLNRNKQNGLPTLEDIKIAMLGNTGAGKTSYLLGMYAVMQTGVAGFTLSARDMDIDLDLIAMWEKLIDTSAENRWPLPNAGELTSYQFDFSYGFKPIVGFEWLDYRGLALTDRSTEQDVRQLSEYLANCSCLFLCVSGEYLSDSVTPFAVRNVKSDRMNQFIQQVIGRTKNPNSDNPFPIVIAISKYDLCNHRDKKEVIEDIKKLFPALFTQNSGWLVMICPVSLGKELSDNIEHGNIVPINVHLPIVFAIYSQMREYALKLKTERNNIYERVERLKYSRLRKLFRLSEIEENSLRLQQIDEAIKTVEDNMNLLAEELKQTSLYLDGQEVTADV
jgi:GTPase SAR1 family protein